MKFLLKAGLASTLALAVATPAVAQYQSSQTYQRDLERYERQRDAYQRGQQNYQQAQREYERKLKKWERDRARYDARYGYGSYARAYGDRPAWDTGYSQAPYAYGQYGQYGQQPYGQNPYGQSPYGQSPYGYGQAPYASGYGVNSAYVNTNCNNGRGSSSVLGALANAALGSRAYGGDVGGAVLGAIVSGAFGGRNNTQQIYKCDSRGPYFSQRDTIAYQESPYDRARNSGRYNYSYYNNQRCRLAPAPIDSYGQDYRYVRVCPDASGRYRITG